MWSGGTGDSSRSPSSSCKARCRAAALVTSINRVYGIALEGQRLSSESQVLLSDIRLDKLARLKRVNGFCTSTEFRCVYSAARLFHFSQGVGFRLEFACRSAEPSRFSLLRDNFLLFFRKTFLFGVSFSVSGIDCICLV